MTVETRVPRPYLKALERAPAGVVAGQHRADVEGVGEVVVFIIGMRINRLWKPWSWWPVFRAMPRMLDQLKANPDSGLLGAHVCWSGRVFLVIQYWRSPEDLAAFARDPERLHVPAWQDFNRRVAGTADVGIFHETYAVPADNIESVYGNMPRYGLSAAIGAVARARAGRTATMGRMQSTEPEYVPAPAGRHA